jgi:hypothetical protein
MTNLFTKYIYMKNPKPMFERNPKVIPCIFSPRIFMKFNGWTKRRQGMNRLWANKLDEIERNPKVIPRFCLPRIFMKFQIQWMNKKEARYERTMNQQLDEIKWNGWPFICGLIRPQTYMRMTTCLCNSSTHGLQFSLTEWVVQCHKLTLTSSTMKEEYLWCIASYDHTSRFRTKTNNFYFYFFLGCGLPLKDASISPDKL